MIGWLKRFTLSLFSDKHAKESARFGFGNILLTSFLAVAFIFLGIFAGEIAPFASYYNGAEDFRGFLYNAFENISVTVSDGSAEITSDGDTVDINTLSDGGDAAAYAVNGYHLFVNSASVASAFDDFDAYCVKTDGGAEIDYEAYLSLPESERKNYRFAVRYSGKIKVVTEDEADAYREYLVALNDEEINSKLEDAEGGEDYAESVYALYVQNYYPDMRAATGETVPTLRTYYYRRTLETDGRYLCLFGDMIIASFTSYNGNRVTFGGTYKSGNDLAGGNQKAVDGFIKNCFYDSASTLFVFDLLNSVTVIAVSELIAVAVMLLGFAACKLMKRGACLKFADSARIVASYVHIAALISAVVTLCLYFCLGGNAITIIE
ncbi:MAG: hypothetical protein K2L72_02600 [Clostridia bacterium]|nr:hypothetical protein [Clostridia bacterium]